MGRVMLILEYSLILYGKSICSKSSKKCDPSKFGLCDVYDLYDLVLYSTFVQAYQSSYKAACWEFSHLLS